MPMKHNGSKEKKKKKAIFSECNTELGRYKDSEQCLQFQIESSRHGNKVEGQRKKERILNLFSGSISMQ